MQIYLLLVGVIGKARMLIFLVSWYFYNVESNRLLRNLVRHVLLKMKRLLWMKNSQMWIVFLKMRYFFFSLIVIITRAINYIIPIVFIWVGKGFIGNWLRQEQNQVHNDHELDHMMCTRWKSPLTTMFLAWLALG